MGFGGSGPAQLALALCCDATGDDARARAVYQAVKFRLVAALPADRWVVSEREVLKTVQSVEAEKAARWADAAPEPPPPPPARPARTPLARRLDAHLEALAAYPPTDATDRESVMRERGWVEALRHLADRGELTHDGRLEAGKLLAASEDWLREQWADRPRGYAR